MSLTFPVSGSTSIGTNEYSLSSLTITGAPFAQTDDAWISIVMEVSTLTAGDRFILTPYEKAYSGATQRAGQPLYIAGPPAAPLLEFGPFRVKHGWDFTVKKDTGTDRVIGASLHQNLVTAATGGSSTYWDRELAPVVVEVGNQTAYLPFMAYSSAGTAVTSKVSTDWTVKRAKTSATAATSWSSPEVTEMSAAGIPGLYKLLLDEGTTSITDGLLEEIVTIYLTCSGVQPITRHIRLTRPDTAYRRFTAAGAGSDTLVLDAGASTTDGVYVGDYFHIIENTGKNQIRTCISYDGGSKTATLGQPWVTIPDNTSVVRQYAGELPATTTDIVNEINTARPATDPGTTYARGSAVSSFMFKMVTTAGANATGKTVTVELARDGGAFAAVAGSVTEISDGWYKVDFTSGEMDGDEIAFRAEATGCADTDMKIRTQI